MKNTILIIALLLSSTTFLLSQGECVERKSISLEIGIDVSPSMLDAATSTTTRLDEAILFSRSVIQELNNTGDLGEVDIYTFCAGINANIGFGSPGNALSALSGPVGTCGGTNLYDAIVLGAGAIKTRSSSNFRLLLILSDGEDTGSGNSAAGAASALQGGIVSRLIYIGGGSNPLSGIANSAGSSSQSLTSSPSSLFNLVDDIVDATCTNHRPSANFSMSDSNLDLGVDGFTITFNGGSSSDREDSDSQLDFNWRFTRPDNSTENRTGSSFTQTFSDSFLGDGTNWSVRLTVEDTRGSTHSRTKNFTVSGSGPDASVNGADEIDALDALNLTAANLENPSAPGEDIDGGPLMFEWIVNNGPPAGSVPIGETWTTRTISFPGPTTEDDITTVEGVNITDPWTFVVRMTDDEGDMDEATKTVLVHNLPPRINLTGNTEIDVGDELRVETDILTDDDGGDLDFSWDLVQTPNSSTMGPQSNFSTNEVLSILTGIDDAGTWIVQLNATDNEGETVSEQYTVLVDGLPEAQIIGPDQIGSLSFPLQLDGSDSEDADSPCGAPDYCHSTSEPPVVISPGITSYEWYLVDFPFEYAGDYYAARVDELFGIPAFGPTMELGIGELRPGDWTFHLEVVDGEGNSVFTTFVVTVIEEEGPPIAWVNPPIFELIDPLGIMSSDIVIDGSHSFDLDNLLIGDPLGPGVGITNYQWTYLNAPLGCVSPPLLPANVPTFNLFNVGDVIDPSCLGTYEIELTVTDDDATPNTASATTSATIYNCPEALCINYPTAANPAFVEFSDDTDILVYYHLNSILYDDPAFFAGLVPELKIYHESDPTTPIFTSLDFNVLGSDKGSVLILHWDGFYTDGSRPQSGKYDISITLLDHTLSPTLFVADEIEAIWIQTAEPEILSTSTVYTSIQELDDGNYPAIDYQINGPLFSDQLIHRVFDASNSMVYENMILPSASGQIFWNGTDASLLVVPPGNYFAELELMRGGASVGKSAQHEIHLFNVDIDADTNRNGVVENGPDESNEELWTATSGSIFNVNYDADAGRIVGGIPVPDAIHFNDMGLPVHEERTIENAADMLDIAPLVIRDMHPELATVSGAKIFLRVPEKEDIQSIHVYKKINSGETAIWGSLGDRDGGAAEPLEVDITQWVDPGSAMYQGDASGSTTFGIEGLFFKNRDINPFDGEIDFILEIRTSGGTVLFQDEVKMKVAPWIMIAHQEPSQELWAMDAATENDEFRQNAAADPGYVGLDNSTQLQTANNPRAGSQWFQDHLEIGYYHRPGGPKTHCVFRLPYHRFGAPPQPEWPLHDLLKADVGIFQIGLDLTGGSGDYGGNLEVSTSTASRPLGKMVIGNTRSDDFFRFLEDQEVQPVFDVVTEWLRVSHVDEIFGFLPSGNQVAVADPQDAFAILNGIPAADRGKAVFFAVGADPVSEIASANATTNTRIETGIDHTGQSWKFIRIYGDTGSGAAGQTAEISTLGNGFIEIDKVWNIPSKIIAGAGLSDNYTDRIFEFDPSDFQTTWFDTPEMGDKYVLVEDTRFWSSRLILPPGSPFTAIEVPAIITTEELLADTDFRDLNLTDVQSAINTLKIELNAQNGGGLSFVKVPTLFVGNRTSFITSRSGLALTPGLANFQAANGKMYFPRQFGARDAGGNDLFETQTISRIPDALFVDDWDLYHRLEGEVHCGTNTFRQIPALNWWDHLIGIFP